MQRSDVIKDLPSKTKLKNELSDNSSIHSLETPKQEANEFAAVTYHKKPWLYGFFGSKDGTSDVRYFGLKSEISAFASECYRTYTNGHSPKYRAVHDQINAVGFITEKVNKPITLSQVFDFLNDLEEDGRLFWLPYISSDCYGSNAKKYFE